MAFMTHCPACNRQTCHVNYQCLDCKTRENQDMKEMELKARSKLNVEERLTLLESDLWDMRRNVDNIDRRTSGLKSF